MTLIAPPQGLPRLLAGLHPSGSAMDAAEHLAMHGPLPDVPGEWLIDEVDRSGLRGRGGADFPTARKLRSVLGRRGTPVLVVNGSETEPASRKDQLLLARLPHLVLDGAELAARAIGADAIIVKVRDSERDAMPELSAAVATREPEGAAIRLAAGPEGYVAGEETSVVQYLSGGPARPMLTPPRPFEKGVRGRPTLVQNVETLAQIGLVARHGASWYRQLGTDADPGSALITIGGAVRTPGVYELAFGTPLGDLLDAAGGPSEPIRAFLIGGYFGTWVDAERALHLRLAREDLRSAGCSLGSGVMIALADSCCGLHESARLVDYLAGQSAGQCGPCLHGLRAIADSLASIVAGQAGPSEADRLLRWCDEVRGRGACHHPNGVTRLVESAMTVFAGDLKRHTRGRCTARSASLPLGPAPGGRRPARARGR